MTTITALVRSYVIILRLFLYFTAHLLLGIQWSIPNVATIIMNEPIIPDWKASYLAPASPAPPKKLPKK